MKVTDLSSKHPTLKEVQEQFETWRKTREKRTAIPDTLWEAAVSLSPRYSLYQISKALRLNYNDLKCRLETSQPILPLSSEEDHAFIDLGLKVPMLPAECSVEMEGQNGGKMRIYFKGEAGLDLLELITVFWGKRS
ncbi:MAG: hypothetical protein H8D67_07065 [Deltaproteobacteria bacterium]|nr:hypothetical protein [Deltaproteobacteria bacterium]